MIFPSSTASATDTTAVDDAGRVPLLLLFGSGLVWLVLSGILSLIGSIQLDHPVFLSCCSCLTYGRVQALAESAFIYGWCGNAGLGAVLWLLGRLGGEPLRAENWTLVGTMFWNTGLLLGLVGILIGDMTSYGLLQFPRYVQPLMLAAYSAVAIGGVLAWTGRRRRTMYAAQWYGVAALFCFPWIFSAAQVLLLWTPVRGTLQAVVQGWYTQGLWSLWLAPIVLACAYYLLPRVKGGVIPAYDAAPLGFWCLVFVGAWLGGRHLIGGPVPAWISTVAIVSSFVLLSHYFAIFLNLRGAICGGGVLRFVGFGLIAYLLTGLLDAVTSIRAIAVTTQFTYFDEALRQLGYYGAVTMILYGALYFALPRISGRPWASAGLARAHFVLAAIGIVLLVVSLAGAGLVQGAELNDPKVAFSAIAGDVRPWLLAATVAQAALLLGNVLLMLNFFQSVAFRVTEAVEALVS